MIALLLRRALIGVAVATFFLFLQPVWVALIAPHLLHAATERIVYVALAFAVGGMAHHPVAVVHGRRRGRSRCSASRPRLAAGWAFAFFQLIVKGLTREVSSTTLVTVECLLDALFILPLALWQFAGMGQGAHAPRLVAAVTHGAGGARRSDTRMWMDGRGAGSACSTARSSGCSRRWPRRSIALVFLGQSITAWTVAGGALILFAGALVVCASAPGPERPLEPPL